MLTGASTYLQTKEAALSVVSPTGDAGAPARVVGVPDDAGACRPVVDRVAGQPPHAASPTAPL